MLTTVQNQSQKSDPKEITSRPHLNYLDGLRGLAALYVAIFHIYTEANYRWLAIGWPHRVWLSAQWMVFGHSAVAIFIVLSGYCLMLPVVRASDGLLQGNILGFLKRRARRILPPYYAALFLSILMLVLTTHWQNSPDTYWDFALPGLTFPVIASHLFLVHDLTPWALRIDPPLWSVAVEFQIYIVYAVLLMPIWQRFGMLGAVAAGFALGLLPHFLLPTARNFDGACPWYLSLFALGMTGAVINFSRNKLETRLREKIPWGTVFSLAMILWLVTIKLHLKVLPEIWMDDIRVGFTTVFFMIFCTRASLQPADTPRPLVLRLLSSPAAVTLGAFSYSLYLIHQPLEALFYFTLNISALSPALRLIIMLFVCLPLVVLCAYLFHLVFEKPFMSSATRKKRLVSEPVGLARTAGSELT